MLIPIETSCCSPPTVEIIPHEISQQLGQIGWYLLSEINPDIPIRYAVFITTLAIILLLKTKHPKHKLPYVCIYLLSLLCIILIPTASFIPVSIIGEFASLIIFIISCYDKNITSRDFKIIKTLILLYVSPSMIGGYLVVTSLLNADFFTPIINIIDHFSV